MHTKYTHDYFRRMYEELPEDDRSELDDETVDECEDACVVYISDFNDSNLLTNSIGTLRHFNPDLDCYVMSCFQPPKDMADFMKYHNV